jgi:hypothetical protein
MAMVVVATALVTDATSNRVTGVTRGESGSKENRPRDVSATSLSRCVTAIEEEGNARFEMASVRMAKAEEKNPSWSSKA